MAKPELGTKRLCPSCGAKYYDLNRDPIICPKCGTIFDIVSTARVAKASKVKAKEESDDEEEDDDAPEMVTLEDADAENEDLNVPDLEDEENIDDSDDDDIFIEEDDEDDENVPGIHVEREGDEEH